MISTSLAAADVIYQTEDPFGGFFGIYGYDVNWEQSVAIRFTPGASYRLDRVQLWLWNNDTSGQPTQITISLRNDLAAGLDGASIPGEMQHESWLIEIPFTGFGEPQLFDFPSSLRPVLQAGVNYWIVAESSARGRVDPVWAIAQPGTGFGAIKNPVTEPWQSGESSVGATIISGTPGPDVDLD